ncbi:MAG: 23S rRNA (guanosine(2251)-2'-O)-methyltransferase RlmB [Chlamydiae bacterium]|nr:23S rRNA (guanosine(2251)-2'-O)-methyltransferase RlmB [Chlamydiota bacterium]
MTRKIMGKNTVEEVATYQSKRVVSIITCSKELLNDYQRKGFKVKLADKLEMNKLVNSDSHQGIIAEVNDEEISFRDAVQLLKEKKRSVVVLLDSIQDPQNMGAIMRACECFGVDLIMHTKNRGSPITATVSKVSMGGSEIVPRCTVSNGVDAIKKLQSEGYWIASLELSDRAESIYSFDFPDKICFVFGSEGEGVKTLLSKTSDFHLIIPMLGKIDSLNVSQASAVVLALLRSKRGSDA